MKLILLTGLMMLTSCDYFNQLKFKYYYSYKGEVLCSVTQETGKVDESKMGRTLSITKLDSGYPQVNVFEEEKAVSYNKLFENEEVVNLQKLDQETGSSQIILLHKSTGSAFYSQIGIENNEVFYRNYTTNCQ